jgi:6-pyruvoyltetrahydropterin/6-carboxytetrahydropterin synthase
MFIPGAAKSFFISVLSGRTRAGLWQNVSGMYTIGVKAHFEAAHCLRGYPGKCARLHGHRWEVEALCRTGELDESGMAVDFGVVKKSLAAVLDDFDHRHLNEIPPFDALNPTAENLARVIFDRLCGMLPIDLVEVTVWESPDCRASWTPSAKT